MEISLEKTQFSDEYSARSLYLKRLRFKRRDNGRMPKFWIAIKRSVDCKSSTDVHDPEASGSRWTRNQGWSVCSRSVMNAIHGRKKPVDKSQTVFNSSPRSLGSLEFANPITHEVVLNESKCELRITKCFDKEGSGSSFVGTLRPGTPGPVSRNMPRKPTNPHRTKKTPGLPPLSGRGNFAGGSNHRGRSYVADSHSPSFNCQKCGENFKNFEAVEAHHLSKHAVSELIEGESSRKIVEMICGISSSTSQNNNLHIETVLKVHNTQNTLAEFEDYRETVKIKASKIQKRHPRCLADGNEVLRFYGTSIACSLGSNSSSSLCAKVNCGVCQILKHGFTVENDSIGVFTTSTCEAAIASIELNGINLTGRKALIVCRVIAGRIYKPPETVRRFAAHSGFDSLVGKVDNCCNIEELYSLNPKALLPCFVVIFCRHEMDD